MMKTLLRARCLLFRIARTRCSIISTTATNSEPPMKLVTQERFWPTTERDTKTRSLTNNTVNICLRPSLLLPSHPRKFLCTNITTKEISGREMPPRETRVTSNLRVAWKLTDKIELPTKRSEVHHLIWTFILRATRRYFPKTMRRH